MSPGSEEPAFDGPELLRASHDVADFDCGVEALNLFLHRHALANQSNGSARTFVATMPGGATAEAPESGEGRVVGYYSLCAGAAEYEMAPERVRKGLACHPVPVVLLARLAVDVEAKGRGLGAGLLRDAFARFLTVQETIGARALLAHAKDDGARAFYERWGFVSTADLPLHLYLLTKDVRATLGA